MDAVAPAPPRTPALVGGLPFYLTGEDNLRVTSRNAASGVVLTVEGRRLTPEGEIVPFQVTHTPNTDRTSATTITSIGTGWLLDAQVRASSGTPIVGQTFVVLEVFRGLTSVGVSLATLVQGYVTTVQRQSYPRSPLVGALDGPGAIRSITGTNPAAGSEIAETVPTGARWELIALRAELVADATVVSRLAALVLDDGTTVFTEIQARAAQTAGVTNDYSFYQGGPFQATQTGLEQLESLPIGNGLLAGFRIRTVTQNLQAGDNWGAPQLLVREWEAA